MPVTNVKSAWSSGNLVFYDASGNIIVTIDGTNRKVTFPSGSGLDISALANAGKGFINLDLFSAQIIGSNEIPDSGNFLDGNTAPEIKRVNAATDKAGFINYIANGVEEIQFAPFAYPPDLDDTAAVEVHVLAKMAAGGMDTPVIAIGYFEGVGDTNAGGNTGALSVTMQDVSRTIAAGDVGAHPTMATVTLTPAAHANEAMEIYAVWIEYTKKAT